MGPRWLDSKLYSFPHSNTAAFFLSQITSIEVSSTKGFCIPLLRSINLLTSRKFVITIHTVHTFWTNLLYSLHFPQIMTPLPYNFVHSVPSP